MSKMVTFKLTYAQDVRLPYKELTVPASATYDEMVQAACEIFNVPASTSSIVTVVGGRINRGQPARTIQLNHGRTLKLQIENDRLPGKFDGNLHSAPFAWSGAVREKALAYTDAGITSSGYLIKSKSFRPNKPPEKQAPLYKTFRNVDEQTANEANEQFKLFKELKSIQEGEVIVTIEHCDDCHLHRDKTWHDVERYHYFAKSIRTALLLRYPMVKVLVKPLRGSREANPRLGAFEVRAYAKQSGRTREIIMHSKLQSRTWPNLNTVIPKILPILPTCTIVVSTTDATGSDASMDRIRVALRSCQATQDMPRLPRPTSARSSSRGKRPQSAASTRSLANLRPGSASKPVQKPQTHTSYTDEEGVAVFQNIPMDNYEIILPESANFMEEKAVFNIMQQKSKTNSYNIMIPLHTKVVTAVSCQLTDMKFNFAIEDSSVDLLSPDGDHTLQIKENGMYEGFIPKGTYTLEITSENYLTVSKEVVLYQSTLALHEPLQRKPLKCTFRAQYFGMDCWIQDIEIDIENTEFEPSYNQGAIEWLLDPDTYTVTISSEPSYLSHTLVCEVELEQTEFVFKPIPTELPMVVIRCPYKGGIADTYAINEDGETINRGGYDMIEIYDQIQDYDRSIVRFGDSSSWGRIVLELEEEEGPSEVTAEFYKDGKWIAVIEPQNRTGNVWDIMYVHPEIGWIETNVFSDTQILECDSLISGFADLIRYIQKSGKPLLQLFKFKDIDDENAVSVADFGKALEDIVKDEKAREHVLKSLARGDVVNYEHFANRYQRFVDEYKTIQEEITEEIFAQMIGVKDLEDEELMAIAKAGREQMRLYPWVEIQDDLPEGQGFHGMYQGAFHIDQSEKSHFLNVVTRQKKKLDPAVENSISQVREVLQEREENILMALLDGDAQEPELPEAGPNEGEMSDEEYHVK